MWWYRNVSVHNMELCQGIAFAWAWRALRRRWWEVNEVPVCLDQADRYPRMEWTQRRGYVHPIVLINIYIYIYIARTSGFLLPEGGPGCAVYRCLGLIFWHCPHSATWVASFPLELMTISKEFKTKQRGCRQREAELVSGRSLSGGKRLFICGST